MQKVKKILLSVLLFSFTFLVFHDFVISEIHPSSEHGKVVINSCAHESTCCSNVALQVHKDIHAFIAIAVCSLVISPSSIHNTKPLDTEIQISLFKSFVLERPPLS